MKNMGAWLCAATMVCFAAGAASQTLSVEITSPSNNAHIAECSDILVVSNVQIGAADIRSVSWYYNGISFGSDGRAPYEYTWKNVPAGFYRLQAKVTDKADNAAWSQPVYIYVGEAAMGNLIGNGQFTCRIWPWNLNVNTGSGARATYDLDPTAWIADSTAVLVTIENGGTENWHVQLQQPFPVDSGHVYIITFVAYALEARTMDVSIQMNKDPWDVYFWTGTVNIEMAQEYGPFVYDCLTNDPGAYIRFNIGAGNPTQFWLDEIMVIDPSVTAVEERTPRSASAATPNRTEMTQNYPNPFNSSTYIHYVLPGEAEVFLDIVNVRGQTVRTLVSGRQKAGTHALSWDGRDRSAESVPSGVYFYRLTVKAEGKTEILTRKLLLIE